MMTIDDLELDLKKYRTQERIHNTFQLAMYIAELTETIARVIAERDQAQDWALRWKRELEALKRKRAKGKAK